MTLLRRQLLVIAVLVVVLAVVAYCYGPRIVGNN